MGHLMPPIHVHYTGAVTVDARLLNDIDWVLDMDTAAPSGAVAPLIAQMDAVVAAGQDPDLDLDLLLAVRSRPRHDYLGVVAVHEVQQLRGWHRLRCGPVTVDAGRLSAVRNILDVELYNRAGCEENLDDGGWTEDDPQYLAIKAAVDAGQCCNRCSWCRALLLRDRIDAVFAAAGYTRTAWQEPLGYDPDRVWREQVAA
jgi:hypothetical protein